MTARRLWLLLLIAGLALMLPFEGTLTRIAGVACLVAFVVLGLFLIASPAYLRGPDR